MAVRTHPGSFTCGKAGRSGATNDQCLDDAGFWTLGLGSGSALGGSAATAAVLSSDRNNAMHAVWQSDIPARDDKFIRRPYQRPGDEGEVEKSALRCDTAMNRTKG